MKFVLFVIVLLTLYPSIYAQGLGEPPYIDKKKDSLSSWPEFTGGVAERKRYFSTTLRYPMSAEIKGIEGTVIIGFVVEKDGSITEVEVIKGVTPSLDLEALRVVKYMPRWKPGKNHGVPVRVKHKIDIVFRIYDYKAFITSLSCDSSGVSDGAYPVYKNGESFAFESDAKQILNHVDYERKAGNVKISFVITRDNQLEEIQVLYASDPMLEEEALNVIRKLRGNWQAGRRKGKPVDVKYTADFTFRL